MPRRAPRDSFVVLNCLQTFTTPAVLLSAVMVEAYKKYILLSLLVYGQVCLCSRTPCYVMYTTSAAHTVSADPAAAQVYERTDSAPPEDPHDAVPRIRQRLLDLFDRRNSQSRHYPRRGLQQGTRIRARSSSSGLTASGRTRTLVWSNSASRASTTGTSSAARRHTSPSRSATLPTASSSPAPRRPRSASFAWCVWFNFAILSA